MAIGGPPPSADGHLPGDLHRPCLLQAILRRAHPVYARSTEGLEYSHQSAQHLLFRHFHLHGGRRQSERCRYSVRKPNWVQNNQSAQRSFNWEIVFIYFFVYRQFSLSFCSFDSLHMTDVFWHPLIYPSMHWVNSRFNSNSLQKKIATPQVERPSLSNY